MATKLDTLLDNISPEKNVEKTQATINEALNNFQIRSARIESWDEFKQVMSDFYCLTECLLLGSNKIRPTNLSMDWGRCSDLLIKNYGTRGVKNAFEISKLGVEGGLYGVLKVLAEALANQFADNWIKCQIGQFWNDLSPDERISVPMEYLEKFYHILPSEIRENDPYIFAANFYRFLEHHPNMMKRLNNIR